MAAILYPTSLPAPSSAPFTPDERRQLSKLDGARIARVQQRDRRASQSLTFLFTFAEGAVFRAWWRDTLVLGSCWFASSWPMPQGGTGVRRFVGSPKWELVAGVGWRVTVASEVRGVGKLPNDDRFAANVVLLTSLDGEDNGTTFVDLTGRHSLTPIGAAYTKTTQAPPGCNASLLIGSGNAFLDVGSNLGDFSFTSGLTIEGFGYLSSDTGVRCPMGCVGWELLFQAGTPPAYVVGVNTTHSSGGSFGAPTPRPPLNQWFHFAITWDIATATGRVFIGGTGYPVVKTGSPEFVVSSDVHIGGNGVTGFPYPWLGYLSWLRVTRDAVRYTSNFTPPAPGY